MKNSSYAIMIAAVMFAATFAGLAIIADDAEAEETPVYKVTYVYGDNVKIETSGATLTLKSFATVFPGVSAPTGYEFDKWKIGSTQYDMEGTAIITGDVTVEPVPEIANGYTIITLKFGEISESYPVKQSQNPGESGVVPEADLKAFGEKIGVTFTVGSSAEAYSISATIDGFEFKGFQKNGEGAYFKNLGSISGTAKSEAVFVLALAPIYDLDFYVDDVKVTTIASNEFAKAPMDPEKANYTFKGWAVDGEIVSVVKDGRIVITDEYVKALTADTDFVAVFAPVQLTLTLVVGDFTSTQPALYGQTITAPGLPDGYSSWATMAMVDDKEVCTVFDFAQPILEDMTLYAQKAEKVYTVSFVSEGVVIGGPYDATKTYTVPADPVVEGKKFVGWFVGDYKVLDIKAYIADHAGQDIVLTASFTEADAPAGPGFFQTEEGQCVIVILAAIILMFAYMIYKNMFGLKDMLTSFKIQRVKKE